jgi:hypothetical protein
MPGQDIGHLPPAGTRLFTSNSWFDGTLEVRPGGSLLVDANATAAFAGPVASAGLSTSPAAVTAPSVPATTVAATNSTGVDVVAYVSGGTVTAIAVNGAAVGLTSGTFYVHAGGTIALTYSAAPTWVWQAV